MIELRWIDRWVERHGENVEERVLQYRTRTLTAGSGGYLYPDFWSEWQDVPVEREE